MSTLIVEVCKIEKVLPHHGADALDLAQIKGWQCVIPKGRYVPGDLVTYIPIDAVIPAEHSDRWGITKYLSNGRVRCARLRGEPSFGVIVDRDDASWPEGMDVQDFYGITKYVPPVKISAGDAAPSHPLFVEYTDVENLRNFPAVFTEGEEVSVSEKIHGCLDYRTRIAMADGTMKRIMQVQPGDVVIGMDEGGRLVPTCVKRVFNNGRAERWLTVRGKRGFAGRGSSFFAVHCTPNHRFWNPKTCEYVAAEHLTPGSPISLLRSEAGLTPVQEQVLLGKLLGDGSLHMSAHAASVEWSQKELDIDYIKWTSRALGELARLHIGTLTSGYGTPMLRTGTTFSTHIRRRFADFLAEDGRKCVPHWVADDLGPISLAFWYMDDGSLAHCVGQEDRALIATCGFNPAECDVLLRGLLKLGVKATAYESKGYLRLRFNTDAAERLWLLIAPYIPPSMQYKLPERYRGHDGWMPRPEMPYKPLVTLQTVDAVMENASITSARWDIETEMHNFFANGVLVHNSSCRLGLVEGEWMAGSMSVRRRRPEDLSESIYWQPMGLPGVQDLLTHLGASHRQVILYGEVFGSKVQSLAYGQVGALGFRAFDLLTDGKYLDAADFASLCARFDVSAVPVLYRGPYALETVKALSEGATTLGADHIREGVVVRPAQERTDPKVGRVCLKYIGDPYLFAKNVTDSHDV